MSQISLHELIRLNEQQLSAERAAEVHQRIEEDPELQSRWNLLRQAYLMLVTDNDKIPPTGQTPSTEIASYIDGNLDEEATRRFENRCWRDPSLLREVLDCFHLTTFEDDHRFDLSPVAEFRFQLIFEEVAGKNGLSVNKNGHNGQKGYNEQNSQNGHKSRVPSSRLPNTRPTRISHPIDDLGNPRPNIDEDDRKTDRGDQGKNNKTGGNNGANNSANDQAPPHIANVRTPDNIRPTRPIQRWPNARWNVFAVSVIAVGILILVSVSIGRFGHDATDRAADSVKPSTQPTPEQHPNRLEKKRFDSDTDGNPPGPTPDPTNGTTIVQHEKAQPNQPGPGVDENKEQPRNKPDGKHLAVDEKKQGQPIPTPDQSPNGQDPYPRRGETRKLAMEWQRTRGILAARNSVAGSWHTIGKQESFLNNTTFMTFPGAWAEARSDDGSLLVLDDNSAVSIRKPDDAHPTSITLHHGRTGVRNARRGNRYLLTAGRSKFDLQVLGDDSEFGLDYQTQGPRIFVRKGSVKINGKNATRGTTGIVARGQPELIHFAKVQRFDEFRWLSKSQSKTVVPTSLKNRLERSGSLEQDLRDLLTSTDPETRSYAVRWRLTVDRGDSLLRSLQSRDVVIRSAAFDWLTAIHPYDPLVSPGWQRIQAFVERQGRTTVSIRNWMLLSLGRNQAWPDQDLKEMVILLNHDMWFYRRYAMWILERKFTNPVGYTADLNKNRRAAVVRSWARFIADKNAQAKRH